MLAENFRPNNILELMKPPRGSDSSEMMEGRVRSSSQIATLTEARERSCSGATPKVGGADTLNTDNVLELLSTAPRERSGSSELFTGAGIFEDFTARDTQVDARKINEPPRTRSSSIPAPGMPGRGTVG